MPQVRNRGAACVVAGPRTVCPQVVCSGLALPGAVLLWVALFAASVSLTGCSLFEDEPDVTLDWSAERLYSEGKAALDAGEYTKALEFYEKLETRYPFGPFSTQAQLETAYAYYRKNEPASAVAAADRFIKLHPQHLHVDYAYYIKGLAQYNQGRGLVDQLVQLDPSERDPGSALQSFEAFGELLRRFPKSRYTKDSAQRMLYLRNNLAQYEIHVANYYLRRGAYVAAANRAKYVLENFDTAPAVPQALVVMAKAYRVLGMEDLMNDALRVLKLNHPDHPGLAEVANLEIE
ncbi:MAG: outer membrane protein assembly factor BamD [Gammaproteobacteria bacterium]|nr:outer membrane protein assembly factor BamD [Gammaproteobacteria bacterium]